MATYTLLEYASVSDSGECIEPPLKQTDLCAFDTAIKLQDLSICVRAVPTVDARIKFGGSTVVANANSDRIYTDVGGYNRVPKNSGLYVYLTAA